MLIFSLNCTIRLNIKIIELWDEYIEFSAFNLININIQDTDFFLKKITFKFYLKNHLLPFYLLVFFFSLNLKYLLITCYLKIM